MNEVRPTIRPLGSTQVRINPPRADNGNALIDPLAENSAHLAADEPLLLVLDSDSEIDEVVKLFIRSGYTKFAGYLVGGMKAWDNAGFELAEVGQMTVHEIHEAGEALQVIDVRAPSEWKEGHIPGARHLFLGELRKRLGELDKTRPTAIYCDSGYRASIAASMLKQEGFTCVSNVPGSWQAWKKSGFPIDGKIE